MDGGGVLGVILVIGIIVGIVAIRSYITKRGNEARADRERMAAANYLRATPMPPPPVLAAPSPQVPTTPVGSRYGADDPPPPPPPGW